MVTIAEKIEVLNEQLTAAEQGIAVAAKLDSKIVLIHAVNAHKAVAAEISKLALALAA